MSDDEVGGFFEEQEEVSAKELAARPKKPTKRPTPQRKPYQYTRPEDDDEYTKLFYEDDDKAFYAELKYLKGQPSAVNTKLSRRTPFQIAVTAAASPAPNPTARAPRAIKEMLDLGADPGQVDEVMGTATIHVFCRAVQCYVEHEWWIQKQFPKLLLLFLASPKTDVNLQDEYGYTPLMLAASCGWGEMAEALLEDKRVDVTIKSKRHETARSLAIRSDIRWLAAAIERREKEASGNSTKPTSATPTGGDITALREELDATKKLCAYLARIVSSLHEVKEDGNTVGNIRELAAALGVDY